MNLDDNPSEIENELKKLGYWDNLYTKNDYFGNVRYISDLFGHQTIENYFLTSAFRKLPPETE